MSERYIPSEQDIANNSEVEKIEKEVFDAIDKLNEFYKDKYHYFFSLRIQVCEPFDKSDMDRKWLRSMRRWKSFHENNRVTNE